jgi:aminopeptidase Y
LAPTASPAPSPTLAPTLTPFPTASTLPSIPPSGPPSGLRVDAQLISNHLDALQQIADDNNGIRAAGTPGYDASADYVAQVMTDLGFQVERQPFDMAFFDETEPVSVGFGDVGWTSPEWLHAALYSASGDVEAPLQLVGDGADTFGCDASEWTSFTPGNVAGVPGGTCYLRQKVQNAQAAGAAALIAFYPAWEANHILRPTLINPAGINVPVVVAGREPAVALRNQEGNVVSVYVQGDNHIATVDNVIATLPGQSDDVIMLGGHLDSVLDGPGINDNGSGVATLMSLAASVAAQPQATKTIRFGFWSAEEFGDLGSAAYVNHLPLADRALIEAYLNLDMVGSPNPARYVYDDAAAPSGSADITQSLLDALTALDAPGIALDMGAGSDHYNFELAGVPIGGLFSGLSSMSPDEAAVFGGIAGAPEDPCYHLACDTTSNVDLDTATLLGQAIAIVLEKLAY